MGEEKKKYISRTCWKCKLKLDFKDFWLINKFLNKKRAEELWQNSKIEFFCCSCYQKEIRRIRLREIQERKKWQEEIRWREAREKEIRERQIHEQNKGKRREIIDNNPDKKVLIIGIQNTGKTAIINTIKDKSLDRAFNLLPTRGNSIKKFYFNDIRYVIWDLGGVLAYRSRWIAKSDLIFSETNEIIYLLDIQDSSNYNDSISYLSDITRILNLERISDTLDLNLKLFILFHKADPDINDSPNILENVEILTQTIESLDIPFNYEILETSIYYFPEKHYESLFNNVLGFGSLIGKLFSPSTCSV